MTSNRTLCALLLGIGAALATLPAAAQPEPSNPLPGVQAAPTHLIERFALVAGSVVQPGREVRYVLIGQPGGRAWVDIPGVRSGIALTETRPGFYEGSYVVGWGDNLEAVGRPFGGLQVGGVTTTTQPSGPAFQYGYPQANTAPAAPVRPQVQADRQPPQIVDITPAQGQRVTERGVTRIAARVVDAGRGVDPRSLVLVVDGRDVSRNTRFDGNVVEYTEDLPRGRHTAELVVRDRAGNASRAAWSFEVEGRGWAHGRRN